jgi:hypothetical protein
MAPKSIPAAVIAAIFVAIVAVIPLLTATPDGVTIIPIRNETGSPTAAGLLNTSGGSITTVNLNGTTQNVRWKAFVGNVSGKLTLDDSLGATIYDWTLSTISGEVYATRFSGSLNWTTVNCSNSTHLAREDTALAHTNPDDNISATFNTQSHSGFYVGTAQILTNTCFSIKTYVNDTAQVSTSRFEEVMLYDGTNLTNGNIIFSTLLEANQYGYNNQTYDFQMIVPERGEPTWQSSTAYYLYVELS